jgi:hypothetical protein
MVRRRVLRPPWAFVGTTPLSMGDERHRRHERPVGVYGAARSHVLATETAKSYFAFGVRSASGRVCGLCRPGCSTPAFAIMSGCQGPAINDDAEQEWEDRNANRVNCSLESAFGVELEKCTNAFWALADAVKRAMKIRGLAQRLAGLS